MSELEKVKEKIKQNALSNKDVEEELHKTLRIPVFVNEKKWIKVSDVLGALGELEKTHVVVEKEQLRETPNERKIKLWLANTGDLPLILRVQTILGLYRKELLDR